MSSTFSSTAKVENLTIEEINAMESADVTRYIEGARRAVKSAEKGRLNATDRAAYATYLAEHVQGIIGASNKPGKDDVDPGWMTDEAWAQSFDKVKSNTGYWRTLGRVLVTLAVDKDSEFYKRLRVSNAYQKPDCKAIINAEDTTAENVEERVSEYLDKHFDKFGQKLPVKRAANPDGQKKAPASITEAVSNIGGSDKNKALVLVAALAEVVGRLDTDGWVEVDSAMETLRSEVNAKFTADLSIAPKAG